IVNETANEQIQVSIVVVIEPYGAGGPAGSSYSCLFRHISKGSIMIIFVESAASVSCHEDIGPAVVVIVAHGDAHTEISAANFGFLCDICEGAVSVVFI